MDAQTQAYRDDAAKWDAKTRALEGAATSFAEEKDAAAYEPDVMTEIEKVKRRVQKQLTSDRKDLLLLRRARGEDDQGRKIVSTTPAPDQ